MRYKAVLRSAAEVVALTLAGILARLLLHPVLGDALPHATFYPVVALSTRLGGYGAGLAAVGLGGLLGTLLFMAPRFELAHSSQDVATVLVFVAVAVMIVGLTHAADTARRRAEEKQADAERNSAMLEGVFTHAEAGLCLVDQSQVFVRVNEAMARICGYARGELEGRPATLPLAEDERARAREVLDARLRGDAPPREWAVVTKEGKRKFIRACGGRAFHVGDEVFTIASVLDVTDLKLATDALRESEQRFRTMADSSPVIVWVTDAKGRIEFVNQAYCEFFGVTEEEVKAGGWQPLVHSEDVGDYEAAFFASLTERRPFRAKARVRRADGEWRWIASHGVPRFSAAGECLGFVGSSPDITDMKRAEAALREAARRKDEFLGMLAHELRNPLGAVTNALDLLRQFGPPNPNFDWARDVIDRQVTQLARMVDDLLDVSRITRGRIELKKEPISLAVPIGLALETARPAIAARRQQLAVNLPAEPLGAEVDATRLAQVVSNLLHNASKFTPEGGRIWLDLARDGAQAVVRVRDAGRGIAPELLPHIFEVFVQGEQGSNPTRGGLGLGLAIARTLVEMHGGTLHAMSAGPECGSEFVVRLPALAELVSATAAGAVLAFDSPARRILLVDDNADFVEGLERVLAAMGHDVRSALDGPGGLALAAEFRPDVVVLDIGLPGMNGYDVARRLRTSTGMENVLLVALSGYGQAEDRQRSRAAGFDHHLVKPITGAALLAVLDRARLRGAPAERRTPELGLGD